MAVLFEGTKIRPPQGFGGNTDFKGGFVERCYCEAGTIDADTIAKMAVIQDFGGAGDGQGGAPIFGLVIELGDNYTLG
jgi:hypothetical protein